ncbi:hypothetical protein DESC_920014 [Desulfosarcina cetonica]|nr:hypothetical protein DESC_920014 [Desulfosarcina cetonica]
MQGEVDAGQQHEQGDDPIDVNAVKIGHGGILGGKAARGHGGEGVVQGIEERHAANHQQRRLGNGEQRVHLPENHGRVADARFELVRHRAGHLGLVELHAADAQKGQNGDGEHDDAHAPQPLNEAAPEQQPRALPLDVGQDRGSGGGEPGDRLEKGVHEGKARVGKVERQGAEEADRRPAHGHDGHAFALADGFGLFMPEDQGQHAAAHQRQPHGLDQRHQAAVHGEKGVNQRNQHGGAEKKVQHTDGIENIAPAHARSTPA